MTPAGSRSLSDLASKIRRGLSARSGGQPFRRYGEGGLHLFGRHELGDIVATGSPAGVGAARKIFMKPGDTSVCTIESIGTLTNPVVGPGQGTR